MHLFFSKEISYPDFTFNPEESRHIAKVLRLRRGDKVSITDGAGNLYSGIISDDDSRRCVVDLEETPISTEKSKFNLHIAVAPTKNLARIEWFVEKATESGISEITPMLCQHSERVHFKSERLERIAIAAIKQSQQMWLPKINELTAFSQIVKNTRPGEGFIAYVDENAKLSLLKSVYKKCANVTVLIGPEGDFSKAEIAAAIQAGFVPISLGKNRLRTETAALVACLTINFINQ